MVVCREDEIEATQFYSTLTVRAESTEHEIDEASARFVCRPTQGQSHTHLYHTRLTHYLSSLQNLVLLALALVIEPDPSVCSTLLHSSDRSVAQLSRDASPQSLQGAEKRYEAALVRVAQIFCFSGFVWVRSRRV